MGARAAGGMAANTKYSPPASVAEQRSIQERSGLLLECGGDFARQQRAAWHGLPAVMDGFLGVAEKVTAACSLWRSL